MIEDETDGFYFLEEEGNQRDEGEGGFQGQLKLYVFPSCGA